MQPRQYMYFYTPPSKISLGIGIGLINPVNVSMIGQYFEKRRALANGLAVAGGGIGSFVLPPLGR